MPISRCYWNLILELVRRIKRQTYSFWKEVLIVLYTIIIKDTGEHWIDIDITGHIKFRKIIQKIV
jgi:hypothetical protein